MLEAASGGAGGAGVAAEGDGVGAWRRWRRRRCRPVGGAGLGGGRAELPLVATGAAVMVTSPPSPPLASAVATEEPATVLATVIPAPPADAGGGVAGRPRWRRWRRRRPRPLRRPRRRSRCSLEARPVSPESAVGHRGGAACWRWSRTSASAVASPVSPESPGVARAGLGVVAVRAGGQCRGWRCWWRWGWRWRRRWRRWRPSRPEVATGVGAGAPVASPVSPVLVALDWAVAGAGVAGGGDRGGGDGDVAAGAAVGVDRWPPPSRRWCRRRSTSPRPPDDDGGGVRRRRRRRRWRRRRRRPPRRRRRRLESLAASPVSPERPSATEAAPGVAMESTVGLGGRRRRCRRSRPSRRSSAVAGRWPRRRCPGWRCWWRWRWRWRRRWRRWRPSCRTRRRGWRRRRAGGVAGVAACWWRWTGPWRRRWRRRWRWG